MESTRMPSGSYQGKYTTSPRLTVSYEESHMSRLRSFYYSSLGLSRYKFLIGYCDNTTIILNITKSE